MKRLTFIYLLLIIPLGIFAQDFSSKAKFEKNKKGIIQSAEFTEADKSIVVPESSESFFVDYLKTNNNDRF